MKGNTKKTEMCGFGACIARKWGSRQKPIQLPSSRADGGKGAKSPEAKHHRRAQQKFNKTGGIHAEKLTRKCTAWDIAVRAEKTLCEGLDRFQG